MVLHNPNNWHWVNKDVREWAKNYLDNNVTGIKAERGDVSVRITKVDSMDGDVDVSQRKGKVITLFDVKLKLDYEGDAPEAAGVIGTITIPEVAHDTEEDEYVVRSLLSTPNEVSSVREAYGTDIFIQFDIDTSSLDASKQPVKDLVRTDIVPQLRKALAKLAPALVAEHGKDIQHAPGSGPPTGYTTPTTKTTSSSAAQTLAKTSSKLAHDSGAGASNGPKVNAVPVNTSSEFRTSAAELFTTFTDPQRIAAFTRSPPTVFEGAKPGGKFSLFGGGVSGEYVSLSEPKQIVQKWRLANWPQGHYSTLTIDFDQNDVDAVTVMRVKWDGVPVGEEEVTEGKWGEYYVRSLKTTFGFGTIL